MSIPTPRLDLIEMTPEFLRAVLARDRARASALIGLELPDEWPDAPSLLELRLKQVEDHPRLRPWLLRAIGLRESQRMIGHIGFHTAPGAHYLERWAPGGVEFGFTIMPEHRRQGFAREASLGLMHWAQAHHGVTQFVMTISPHNTASLGLAASLGFQRVGSHEDEVDGLEGVFVLAKDS
jgi:RimJ/RimL family protein N-acetyltransferase